MLGQGLSHRYIPPAVSMGGMLWDGDVGASVHPWPWRRSFWVQTPHRGSPRLPLESVERIGTNQEFPGKHPKATQPLPTERAGVRCNSSWKGNVQKHVPRDCTEPDNANYLFTPKQRARNQPAPSPSPTTMSPRPCGEVRAR